jgi:UDP-hydrolysing UDP-N-acetyl-D-glucosamine 2-epimerase
VTTSGAPALDALSSFEPLDDDELAAHGVRLRGPTLLVTYHPVTLAYERTGAQLRHVLDAIAASGLDAVFTFPNADTRHGAIVSALEQVAHDGDRYTVVPSLGQRAYFTLMSRAAAMVGNSSSGLIEAASFGLPVVDVGMRQQGRLRPRNVLHVDDDAGAAAVATAIERATSSEFRESLRDLVNPYGDGRASRRIVERLLSVPLDERLLVKHFHDL